MNVDYWRAFLAKNPKVTSALMGSTLGGAVGGVLSDPGAEGRGVAQGALLGGIAGGLGGTASHFMADRAAKMVPSAEGALAAGAVAGGTLGGYLGKRQISPWVVQHLRQQGHGEKEASVSQPTELEKKAAMEKDAEITNAFDFGMNLFLKEQGIDRAELIKKANQAGAKVDDASLAEATLKWVTELQDQK